MSLNVGHDDSSIKQIIKPQYVYMLKNMTSQPDTIYIKIILM